MSPLRDEAEARGTPVWAPESVNHDDARRRLTDMRPDLLVVCDYGEILSPETLSLARLGGINLHASLLPKYRGAAPVPWAVYHGESETGITVIQMTPGLDAGPCLAQHRTAIDPEETAAELEARLALMGAPLVCQILDELAAGRVRPVAQDARHTTRAPRLKKTDGLVDWSRSAGQIKNQVRAMQPWPTAYTFCPRVGREPLRLILHEVAVCPASGDARYGRIVQADHRLVVATGDGFLELVRVQPAGKRILSGDQLLRGYPLKVGQQLGPPDHC
jgi:methionyl-tRNA formyltransferase